MKSALIPKMLQVNMCVVCVCRYIYRERRVHTHIEALNITSGIFATLFLKFLWFTFLLFRKEAWLQNHFQV